MNAPEKATLAKKPAKKPAKPAAPDEPAKKPAKPAAKKPAKAAAKKPAKAAAKKPAKPAKPAARKPAKPEAKRPAKAGEQSLVEKPSAKKKRGAKKHPAEQSPAPANGGLVLSSPESTGHAGSFFEQHVDVAFLTLLLVRGVAPFLVRAEIVEIHLQASHLGWATDDLLAIGVDQAGARRSLAVSVKRTFTMAKSDPEFVDVFTKAWADFRTARFDRAQDAIALITRSSSAQMMRSLRVLLETARASLDGADFRRRLDLPKYRDKVASDYAATIRETIEQTFPNEATDDQLHAFLRVFDFACLDLDTTGSTIEALLLSLLRSAATPGAGPEVGSSTWTSLLELVTRASPNARSFKREDLPAGVREHFPATNAHITQLLDPFQELTRTVSSGIEMSIAGHHEPRRELEQQLIDHLNAGQVVLVGGLAGSGKSAVAKAVFDAVGNGALAIAMRAEMLAKATLGETLLTMGTSLSRLREVMVLHGTKLLWIDGAERMLEKPDSERGAFNDMMRLVRQDPDWKVLITCRAYSLETFEAAFLTEAGIASVVVSVPALESAQLDSFASHCPKLARPLSDPSLRSLLSNPFFLKMAARLDWDPKEPLPKDERAFRAEVWKQVIRRDSEAMDGLPLRRAATFIDVALRRAHSFDAFVDVTGLDATAVVRLNSDTLLVESSETLGRYAPAHDVLEDWALLQWLDGEFERCSRKWSAFLESLGTHPAIRRTFRTWLGERVDLDAARMQEAISLVTDKALPRHWVDDAIVAILRSRDPAHFLATHESSLLADDAQLLRRAIHLARVACQEALTSTPLEIAAGAQRPVGLAWRRIADFVAQHLSTVVPHCAPLLVEFIKDWSSIVTWAGPSPAEAGSIGLIACRLLDDMDVHSRSRDSEVSSVVKVLLKIPKVSEQRIREFVSESIAEGVREHDAFAEPALSSLYGAQLARDLPDVVIAMMEVVLSPPTAEERNNRGPYGHRASLAERFGLRERLEHYGHPASAYNGPSWNLLRFHPADGLALVINTVNRCSDAYLAGVEYDTAWSFDLSDGQTVVHRGDGRLWAMYRVNSGPDILRSMLMALEMWMLSLGEQRRFDFLRKVVAHVMKSATSLALTAVVASVVMAFPDELGEYGLTFLRVRNLFELDRGRAISDLSSTDKIIAEAFPAMTAEVSLFNEERVLAAARPHRRMDFEGLAWWLQNGPLRDSVWRLLEVHASRLPAEEEQNDGDRLWRLALHRMDQRNVRLVEREGARSLAFAAPPADVMAVIERDRPASEANQLALAMFRWAETRFSGAEGKDDAPTQWRTALDYARQSSAHPYADARLLVALVCLRDHANELTDDEFDWCVEATVAPFAELHFADVTLPVIGGYQEAAAFLPGFSLRVRTQRHRDMVYGAIFIGLVSGQHAISRRIAAAIGRDLWSGDRDLALSFATGLIEYTHREFALTISERRTSFMDPRNDEEARRARNELKAEVADAVEARRIDVPRLVGSDYTRSPARFDVFELGEMFIFHPEDADARAFVLRLSELLRQTWAAEARNRHSQDREGFGHETETFVLNVVTTFALRSSEEDAASLIVPFCEVAAAQPEEIAEMLHRFGMNEGDVYRPTVFWGCWKLLALPLIEWVNAHPNAWDSTVSKVLGAVFLDLYWKETTKSWRSLTQFEGNVTDAFRSLRASEESVDAFVKFLATIGSSLVPDVFPLLAEKLGEPGMAISPRALQRLETMLAGLVYSGTPRVRNDPTIREAMLRLLDVMIDAGSSKAYRMRDDFVTPLRNRTARA